NLPRTTLRRLMERHDLAVHPGALSEPRPVVPPAPGIASPPPASIPMARSLHWVRRAVTLFHVRITSDSDVTLTQLNGYRGIALEKISSFGGHLVELTPDGVLAVFGAEPAENAPLDAARAALALRQAAGRWPETGDGLVSARVALHTAPVLVGSAEGQLELGLDDAHPARTVLDQLLAEPADIVVSPAAIALLERHF